MNEIEDCEKLVDSLLSRLGLPSIVDEERSKVDADLVEVRLAIMFPNLSAQERSGIAGAYLARAVIRMASDAPQDAFFTEQRREFIVKAKISHQNALDALEQYGLRAKLTDFQEELFFHLCEDDEPK